MTNVRILGDYFGVDLPPTHCATLGGVVQECLQHIPQLGDQCTWGPFAFEVSSATDGQQLVLNVRMREVEAW
jgi:Mg2+/Co2+ transporter CorC